MHYNETNLRVPGPTPVPERVAQAGARPMINHRGPEFAALMSDVIDGLKPFFGTEQEPLLLTGSGTGALEATVVNMLSPGDEVLSVTIGVFGNRFADIAEAFGVTVHRLQGEWGQAVQPAQVVEALEQHPEVKAVFLTHNETSTGVTIPLAEIAAAVRKASPDVLILVDGISSIGAVPFQMDAWDIDVAMTGSQKAWMSPPGMTMVAVSERGWAANAGARLPRFYWDFGKARKNGVKRTMPFTPAVGVMFALQEALCLMQDEGVEEVYARHRHIGDLVRGNLAELGLELFADPAYASNTVTAVRVPAGIDASTLLKDLRQTHRVVLGSGQDWLKGSIFRIGHMGYVREEDIVDLFEKLPAALDGAQLKTAV